MKRLAVGTTATLGYLPAARVFVESFRRHHPDVPVYLLLLHTESAPAGDLCHVVTPAELLIPDRRQFLFKYDLKQVATALSPCMLDFLLDEGYESALLLDPDMLVRAPLDDLFEQIQAHALTLCPHIHAAALTPERNARERQLLLAGIYNAGLVGVTDRPETRAFLDWWRGRLMTHCDDKLAEGLHFDQRWLDLAPGFVEDLHLLRDPGINTAYWNLPDYRVEAAPSGLLVDGHPCRLFHFSGFDPTQPTLACRHAPGLAVDQLGPAASLFRDYAGLLNAAGYEKYRNAPWPWEHFDNGAPITAHMRTVYRTLGEAAAQFGDPFATAPAHSFYRYWRKPSNVALRAAGTALRLYRRWRGQPL